VLAADTGAPLRRAEVRASIAGANPRLTLTDADGRFELRGLPAGSVTLRAAKTGFVAQQFGQRSPFAAGESVSLGDAQQLTIDFGLVRGGAISGRVFDDLGDPVANVRVSALRPTFTTTGRRLTSAGGGPGLTDDTGAYRLYGLAPGTYYVSATVQGGPAIASGQTETYAATYFPGTIESASAQRVSIGIGQEQHNIDFALMAVRTVPLAGTVVNSSGQPVQANVSLSSGQASDEVAGNGRRARTSSDGRFTLPNVAPGNYVLEVNGRTDSPDATPEVAAVPISVDGSDMSGLIVTLGRGASVIGTLATDDGSRLDMTGSRVTAAPARNAQGGAAGARVTGAMFQLTGLVGARTFRFEQLPSGWSVKSVSANGVDITDSVLEFRGTEQVSLRVILTSRVTQLSGTVLSNRPTRGAGIVVFADEPSTWTPTTRYVRTARADDNGQFTVRALPGNQRYLAVALDYIESGEHLDPDFLNRVRPLATSISLDEGEQARLDLTLQARP
jgi:hypothetical protein